MSRGEGLLSSFSPGRARMRVELDATAISWIVNWHAEFIILLSLHPKASRKHSVCTFEVAVSHDHLGL